MRKLLYLLLLLPLPALASVSIDTANIWSGSGLNGSSSITASGTVGASDNYLIVIEGNRTGSLTPQSPTGITYNGVALTLLPSSTGSSGAVSTSTESSIWYLATPPTGTSYSLVVSYGSSVQASGMVAIPVSGMGSFGTPAVATSTSNNNSAVTVSGGTSTDIYVAAAINAVTTQAASGANQTDLVDLNGISTNNSFTASDIPGVDTGAFTWSHGTVNTSRWSASGVALLAGASCTHQGYTSAGALAVPNGTSGSYVGKTGGFVTPDCSTVNYWQPTVGNFGTN